MSCKIINPGRRVDLMQHVVSKVLSRILIVPQFPAIAEGDECHDALTIICDLYKCRDPLHPQLIYTPTFKQKPSSP